MTFKHKLAARLARLKDHRALLATAALVAAVVGGCERPISVTEPVQSLTQFLIAPQAVTLQQNQTQDFTAVGFTNTGDTASIAVAWSATGGTIDTSSNHGRHYGHYHGTTCGDYAVTATSTPGAMKATASVTILCPGAVPVDTVLVTPATVNVVAGSTVQLGALLQDSAGNVLSGRTVVWTSSDAGVATVSATGLVSGVAAGSAAITATSGGKSGTAAVTVTPVPVASVTVTPTSASVQAGQTIQLTATPKDANGNALSGRTISWSSSNASVATVSSSGLVTGVVAGSTAITATAEGQSGTSAITVTAVTVPVAAVTVSPASASVVAGQTVQLTATPKDASGNALTGRTITWASSNTAVATVSSSGLVRGVAAGAATITVTSEGKSGTSAITVTAVPVATVTVSPAVASVVVSQTVQLTATPKDANGNTLTGRTVTWGSSNTTVATVSPSGLVIGVAAGSATITATSESKSGTSAITVTASSGGTGCQSACWYVDGVAGNDANAGTSAAPWRTIQHAADVMNPGDTVIVNDGVYTGGTAVVSISRSGTASAWLVFRAAHRWAAVIDGQNNSSTMGFNISGNYIHVEGFEVRNTNRYGFEVYGGSETVAGIHDIDVLQNHIHDIGHVCSDDVGGRVGVDAYADNLTIERNVIHDVGRLGPGEQGCSPATTVWQNHDHGVYHGVGDNVVIRNNLFYNFTHGWAIQRYSGPGAVPNGLTIVNNTFAFPNPWRDGQIIIATGTTNLLIANNVFYQPTTAGVVFETGGLSNVTVSNNLTYGGTALTGASGLTVTGNLDNTNPMFVNISGLDFHVQSGSPAIGAGMTLATVPNDFDGVVRSGAYTIGAYQFH